MPKNVAVVGAHQIGIRRTTGMKSILVVGEDPRSFEGTLATAWLVAERFGSRGIEIALKEFKEPVGPSVCQRAAFVSAAVRGGWVGAYAVESPARDEIAALAKRVKRAAA